MTSAFTFPKNRSEEIRLSVEDYMGCELTNFRIWFREQDGEMHPTRKGISFRSELLPDVMGVDSAQREVT